MHWKVVETHIKLGISVVSAHSYVENTQYMSTGDLCPDCKGTIGVPPRLSANIVEGGKLDIAFDV